MKTEVSPEISQQNEILRQPKNEHHVMSPTDGSSDLALLTNWINDKKEAGIANSEDQLIVCFEQGHRS